MAVQKQDGQHEHTFSNYVRIQDVVLKTCLRRWTIGSGISVLPARHDDDDDDDFDRKFALRGDNDVDYSPMEWAYNTLTVSSAERKYLPKKKRRCPV